MSSCPGYTLEAFLMWNYNLRVQDSPEANIGLGMAELMGHDSQRPLLTQAQFAPIVEMHEPHRETVEHLLDAFDEETQSWRSYGSSVDDCLPQELTSKVQEYLKTLH